MSFDYKPIGYGATVYSGFAFRSSDLINEGIPVIKIGNIQNKTVDYSSSQFFLEEKITEKHKKFLLEDKDVLIAMTGQGSVGRVGRIRLPISKKILLNQRVGKFVTDDTKLNKEYLYYVISSAPYEEMLFNAGSGSGQPNLSPNTILSLEIPYPTIPEQETIAATLSCLDDKIELNNHIIANLEAQAQAIFKSWFVDFEPFQDGEFEESELGLIPKGWICTELGRGIERITERVKEKSYPVLSAIKTGNLVLSEEYFTKKVFSDNTSNYITVKIHDFAYNPARINIGSIGINRLGHEGCVSPVYIAFRANTGYHNYFDFFIRSARFREETVIRSSGSVRQNMTFEDLSKIFVVLPPSEVVEKFNDFINSNFISIEQYKRENLILQDTRDILLPKLMSGEIEVPVEG